MKIKQITWLIVWMLFAPSMVGGQQSPPPLVSLCDVLEKPDKYRGRTLLFRAQVRSGLSTPLLVDPRCEKLVALFEFGNDLRGFSKLTRRMNDLEHQERFDKIIYSLKGVWNRVDSEGSLPIKGLLQNYRMTLLTAREYSPGKK